MTPTLLAFLTLAAHDIQDVLPSVLDKVGSPGKYYVEFGYNKASWQPHANVGPLKAKGWSGLLLDIDNHNPSINLYRAFISSQTIVPIFQNHSVPTEPDYVSIDIDSSDVWVLDAMLTKYKPRVISVEFNCNYEADGFGSPAFPDWVRMRTSSPLYGKKFHWGRGGLGQVCYFGSSSRAVMKAAEYAGYVTVDVACTVPSGIMLKISRIPFCTDLIFVRKDLLTWTVRTVRTHTSDAGSLRILCPSGEWPD